MQDQTGAPVITRLHKSQILGDYEIISVAGTGGMGIVYKARQRSLGRVVALKVIREEIARTPEYRERFLREARLAASVDHPHVVSVYDVGDQDNQLFLAMQWIDGEDLKHLIDTTGRLAADRAAMIATQLAGALDAVHSVAGLVHRDVKPANVLLRQVGGSDHAYLTDFGVAKPSDSAEQLTQTGWVVGTTGYLSPEQIRGREPGPRSDLYALGCLFFEALTGQPPFRGENEMALRWAHANDPRPTPSALLPALGDRYDHFFATALAVDPEQRFGSGREFASTLASAHIGEWTTASQPIVPPPHTPTAVGPPTPIPPPANTPPPGPPVYPAYGYATPPPAYPQPTRSGNPLALVLLGVIALAGIAVGALAAAGVFSHSTPTKTITSATGVAAHARPAPKNSHPRSRVKPSPAASGGGSPASGTTSCGGDLTVGPNTSCGFAQNVEQSYDQSGGGEQAITAYSPATGNTFTIDCSGGSPHVCTGGTTHNASIYFTSGPAATPTPAAPSGGGNLSACDQNVQVNSVTSCPFAENVFEAYANDYQNNGEQSNNVVIAYSPVTSKTYNMDCATDGTTVTCTGGKNSFVTFPITAVEDY